MRKFASLVMFTFLVVVGYYVGAAVAQSNDAVSNTVSKAVPAAAHGVDGVLIVEESYGVVVQKDSAPQSNSVQSETTGMATNGANDNIANQENDAAVIDEMVTETIAVD